MDSLIFSYVELEGSKVLKNQKRGDILTFNFIGPKTLPESKNCSLRLDRGVEKTRKPYYIYISFNDSVNIVPEN